MEIICLEVTGLELDVWEEGLIATHGWLVSVPGGHTGMGVRISVQPWTGCGISVLVTDAPKPQIPNSEESLKADPVRLVKCKHALDSWGILGKEIECEYGVHLCFSHSIRSSRGWICWKSACLTSQHCMKPEVCKPSLLAIGPVSPAVKAIQSGIQVPGRSGLWETLSLTNNNKSKKQNKKSFRFESVSDFQLEKKILYNC